MREGVIGKLSGIGTETSPEDDIVATVDNRFEVDQILWLGLIGIALAMLILIAAIGLFFSRTRRESRSPTEDQNKNE